jgi:uncharacterized protein (DUF1501 family)
MLDIGSFRSKTCAGITRRAFVRAAASAPLALGLPTLQARTAAPEMARKAKSILIVWLSGGPSHIDTFDPKPSAPDQYAGPFAPIATRTPGVHFSEILPRLAARSDKFAVIRSSQVNGGHDLTGLTAGGAAFSNDRRGIPPNFGSIVAKHHGMGRLPPFMSIWPPGNTSPVQAFNSSGQGAGVLGPMYDPFSLFCSADGRTSLAAGIKLLPDLSPERLTDRNLLRKKLDSAARAVDSVPATAWDRHFESAHQLLMGLDTQKAFELSREKETCRDAYGHTSFGQSLLLGRRLVEAGVPYVQVNWSTGVDAAEEGAGFGWDTHCHNFERLFDFLGPVFDRAFAALLDDLAQRGLLESTLVVALGEFGRSPLINKQGDLDGRDHWGQAGFTLWAGAGVQGGRIIGATDRLGGTPVTEPITRLMIGTTIVELAGVDLQARAELRVLGGGRVIHELF